MPFLINVNILLVCNKNKERHKPETLRKFYATVLRIVVMSTAVCYFTQYFLLFPFFYKIIMY